MNLPFQRPTADSLALSVVCLLTVRVLDISDKKKKKQQQQQNPEEKQTRSYKNNQKMI